MNYKKFQTTIYFSDGNTTKITTENKANLTLQEEFQTNQDMFIKSLKKYNGIFAIPNSKPHTLINLNQVTKVITIADE